MPTPIRDRAQHRFATRLAIDVCKTEQLIVTTKISLTHCADYIAQTFLMWEARDNNIMFKDIAEQLGRTSLACRIRYHHISRKVRGRRIPIPTMPTGQENGKRIVHSNLRTIVSAEPSHPVEMEPASCVVATELLEDAASTDEVHGAAGFLVSIASNVRVF